MSTSYGCEEKLRNLASKLYDQAHELEKAADILRSLRDYEDTQGEIESVKRVAKEWMTRIVK